MELLELEYNRVRSEVEIEEQQNGSAPLDLVNQFRHLKERLEQQKTLIDDLEYQYFEVRVVKFSDINIVYNQQLIRLQACLLNECVLNS